MSERASKKGYATAMDQTIGQNMAFWRNHRGMTQMSMAAYLGITYQQLQKLEKGNNRTSFARLYEVSNILAVPISYFFMPPEIAPSLATHDASKRHQC